MATPGFGNRDARLLACREEAAGAGSLPVAPVTSQSSMMKVTIMLTWYSVMASSLTRTCCSLIHELRTLRSVLFARAIPSLIAASNLVVDVALISDTFATDIFIPSVRVPELPLDDRCQGTAGT